MYKIINISDREIGLMIEDGNIIKQKNIQPEEEIEVEKVSEQMYQLADPLKEKLVIKQVGEE